MPGDIIVTEDGRRGVAGSEHVAIGWGEPAQSVAEDGATLQATFDFKASGPSFPFGAHVAVVEVDRETGQLNFSDT